jgi:two-component system, OmpR family, KDP operon response regulator KdpE
MATTQSEGPKKKILGVDDEAALLRVLKSVFLSCDYEFIAASTGEEALDYAVRYEPDAVVLELTLPGISGFDVCSAIREWSDVPILVLSARDSDADKIMALDLGADDYLTKPFSPGELLARVRALLRRPHAEPPAATTIDIDGLTIDLRSRRVMKGEDSPRLTRTEFDILALLALGAGRAIASRAIIDKIWGTDDPRGTQALRVHVSHLRAKIEDNPSSPRLIVTEPGVGYRLNRGSLRSGVESARQSRASV